MKKLFILFTILSTLFFASSALAWNLFFIDQMENIAEPGDPEVMGFVLGTKKVAVSSVVIVKTVGLNSMFIYTTKNNALAVEAYSLPEFRGFGYVDMVTRIAQGLSNAGTWNEIKYITAAHWWVPAAGSEPGHWHFGDIHEWETAGSPEPVWFGRYRDIFGVTIE